MLEFCPGPRETCGREALDELVQRGYLLQPIPQFQQVGGEGFQRSAGRALASVNAASLLLERVEELLQGVVGPRQVCYVVAMEQALPEPLADADNMLMEPTANSAPPR